MTAYVLTRTAMRPTMFGRLRRSVLSQKFDGEIIHLVHAEMDAADYAEGNVVVRAPRLPKILNMTAPWELYNQRLLDTLGSMIRGTHDAERKYPPGWIMFIDDDDMFTSDTAVARALASAHKTNDQLLVWKVERENGRISPFEWPGDLSTDRGRICWEGAAHHTKYIGYSKIDGDDGGDGRYWRNLARFLPIVWVDEVIMRPQLEGRAGKGHGRRRDT